MKRRPCVGSGSSPRMSRTTACPITGAGGWPGFIPRPPSPTPSTIFWSSWISGKWTDQRAASDRRGVFSGDPSFLPVAAGIMLDKDDVNRISDDRVEAIVLHEMGHAVGFGTGTWRPNNLLQNPSLHENGDSIVPTPDTDFSGTNAIAAFNAAGGSNYTGPRSRSRTPLGDRATGTFTGGSPCSKNELMTSRLGDAVSFPLSAVTIQSHMLQR